MNERNRAERADNIGEHLAAPPIDFPVYGLDGTWQGDRWLESAIGDSQVAAVWLGHATNNAGVLIGTLPRLTFDQWYSSGRDLRPEAAAALATADYLLNLLGPDQPTPRPPGLGQATLAHVQLHARAPGEWPRVSWKLAPDRVLHAGVWHFAGRWIALSEDLPDAHIAAVGVGMSPAELPLSIANDNPDYGIDFNTPTTIAELGRGRPPQGLPRPDQEAIHPDQLALLPDGDAT